MRDTVLVFGAGAGQLPYLRDFRARGLRVCAVDRSAEAPGAAEADDLLAVSTHDDAAILERLQARGLDQRLVAVACPATGWAGVAAARVAAELGLRFPSEAAVLDVLDKHRLWGRLREAGLTRRACRVFADGDVVAAVADALPAVVKPSRLGGTSRGVAYCADEVQLREAVARAASMSLDGLALAESFLPGPEVKLAGLLQGGRARVAVVAARSFGPGPLGAPIGLAIGPAADAAADPLPRLVEAFERFAAVAGLQDVVFNTDFILAPGGPELIDVDIALGSFRGLVADAGDVDLAAQHTRLCLGEPLDDFAVCRRGAAVTYLWCAGGEGRRDELLAAAGAAAAGGRFVPDPALMQGATAEGPRRVGALHSAGATREAAAGAGRDWLGRVQAGLVAAGNPAQVVLPE